MAAVRAFGDDLQRGCAIVGTASAWHSSAAVGSVSELGYGLGQDGIGRPLFPILGVDSGGEHHECRTDGTAGRGTGRGDRQAAGTRRSQAGLTDPRQPDDPAGAAAAQSDFAWSTGARARAAQRRMTRLP